MTILHYCALTDQQFQQLKHQLDFFKGDRSRRRKLYEIQYSIHDLKDFPRPSDSQVVCVHRKVLKNLLDPALAYRAIEASYGDRVVEFVPPIRKR